MREFCVTVPPLLVDVSDACRAGWLSAVASFLGHVDRLGWWRLACWFLSRYNGALAEREWV
jgi:hypothetical protein